MKIRRFIPIAALGLVALLNTGCGGGGEANEGRVVEFGQSVPAGGGMVQSFVNVELEDGEEVTVWLPQDQAIWDTMIGAARTDDTAIEFEKDGDLWMYVDVVSGNDDSSSTFAMDGTELPTYEAEAAVDPAVGTKAPIVVTTDFAGDRIVTGSGGGPNDTAKVIGFFAHWCPHCQAELPRVTTWLAENELPDRVAVIAVSTLEDESRGNYPPQEWFDSVGWTDPVLVDTASDEIAQAFGLESVPYWVVLDDSNTVLARTSGELDTSTFESFVALAASGVH